MAEPKPTPPARNAAENPSPKLVAVPEGASPPDAGASEPEPEAPERKVVPRWLFAIVVVALLFSLAGLWAQTQHARAQGEQIAQLGGQVEGLEVQLSAANTQLATYDMRMVLIQGTVLDLSESMGKLQELVEVAPLMLEVEAAAPPAPEPAIGPEPAP